MATESIGRGPMLDLFHSSREAVFSLKVIMARMSRAGRPSKGARKEALSQLRKLTRDGSVEQVVGGYRLARRDGLREGVVETTSSELVGTVVDAARQTWEVQSALPIKAGQKVLFAPGADANAPAAVVDPIAPAVQEWVGVLQSKRRDPIVVSYNSRARFKIAIGPRGLGGAVDGEIVLVRPVSASKQDGGGEKGKVVERLGRPGDAEADFRAIAWNHKLRIGFEPDTTAEADAIPDALDPVEIARRLDLRAKPFLTIDPADARDHDDALYVEEAGEGFRLFVAIADVAHYVRPGSHLDREALLRGNSVYFPGRVIPMLPERISGDLCSLREGRDRFVMIAEMKIGKDGNVLRSSYYEAVIRSHAGLSYEQAAAVMGEGGTVDRPIAPEVKSQVVLLGRLETVLGKRRFENGSIDFDLSESQIEMDDEGRPARIVARTRTRAHRAVEEAMLLANQSVSDRLHKSGIGAVYRIHEEPESSKLEMLEEQLGKFGLLDKKSQGRLRSKTIHDALRRAAGRPEAPLLNMSAVRTMKQARYMEENRGHYALGFDSYLHFTSPIRRYADLQVHRALKHWLEGGQGDSIAPSPPELAAVARRVSFRERVAVDAERDIVDLKKCVFMQPHVGKQFDGRVTGVASHGLYVTLDEHDVNGLVPIASLGSSLIYDEGRNALIARRSGANYALGDTMRVELEEVNLARAWIRFLPIDSDGNVARGRPTGRPAGKPGVRGRGGASARSKGGASGNRGAASRGKSSATRGKGSASRGKGPASRDKDEASETAKTGAKPVRRTKRRARPKGAPTPDKTRR